MYIHTHTHTNTLEAEMATVTMNPNELPLSCLQLGWWTSKANREENENYGVAIEWKINQRNTERQTERKKDRKKDRKKEMKGKEGPSSLTFILQTGFLSFMTTSMYHTKKPYYTLSNRLYVPEHWLWRFHKGKHNKPVKWIYACTYWYSCCFD